IYLFIIFFMKRFLSICLLFVFISINTNLVQAINVLATNSLSSQVIYYKTNLQKIPSGVKYIKTIDSLILKLEENQDTEKLVSIKNKLETIKLDSKATNTKALLDYILAKINLSLDNLSKIEIKTEAPNAEDKAKVEKEILFIQKQIYDTLLSLSNQTENELNKAINYEEKGSFSANIAANYALV
ncbi:secreted protein, partial [sediment metagenome]